MANHTLKSDLDKIISAGVANDLVEKLGIQTDLGREFLTYALANTLLFDRKNQDYGPKNISGFGSFGCVVRMSDKFDRLKNLYMNRRRRAVNESIEDSFRDIANYALISLMWEHGIWPR